MGCVLCKNQCSSNNSNKKKKKKEKEKEKKKKEKQKQKKEVVEEPSDVLKAVVDGVRVRNEKVERQRDKKKKKKICYNKSRELLAAVTEPKQLYHSLLTTQEGWPKWLSTFAPEAIQGWMPRRAFEFEKLDKIGQGTYSNVFKAREKISGKIVALKKVGFDSLNEESVKFMAREIVVLRRLNHPNVIKLEGLVTSRMSSSLYLVFEYMDHDLTGLLGSGITFTQPQVKCYMKQLLSGLEHCHNQGVLHRDIKGSNLLLDNEGVLKIADFGLASFYDPDERRPLTNRVITLWYRPPELLLGGTEYGFGVDLWSAGCILGELLTGKPMMPGRTEVEQLHMIFKLCGSPSEEYWKKSKLPNASKFKLPQPYKRCIQETFIKFPPSSRDLIETLLAMDPDERGTAASALASEFFTTKPCACEPSSLPRYPSSKEMDVKMREEKSRRQRGLSGKGNNVGEAKRARYRDRGNRAVPTPEANAELQVNLDKWRLLKQADAKSKSEKFPPPHQDGAVGFLDRSRAVSFVAPDRSFTSSIFEPKSSSISQLSFWRNPTIVDGPSRIKMNKEGPEMNSSRTIIKDKQPASDVFGG